MNETSARAEAMGRILDRLINSNDIDTAIVALSALVERVPQGE